MKGLYFRDFLRVESEQSFFGSVKASFIELKLKMTIKPPNKLF